MNNSIEIIGIDHGWSQMKTSNYCFNTSIKELPNVPAFTDNVLQYDNRHFAVGDERLEVLDSKVENENFYLLTLVAMAKEMKSRGLKEADIALAVGLPLTRFSAERKPFIEYLSKNEFVAFTFENDLYRAHIMNVSVFPQCYAAIAGMLPSFGKKALVVDIGSWTIDSMMILDKRPDSTKCDTQNEGLIRCMRSINRLAVQVKNHKIDEADIQEYMITGRTALPDEYKELMDQETVVKVKIKESVPSGVVTYLEGIRAFIPASQIASDYVENTDEWIGKEIEARVITVDKDKTKLVLSGKVVAREKETEERNHRISMMVPGSVVEGTVESIMPYGAFVSLGNGISGLVHISQICHKRIANPGEVVKEGQKVKVKILNTNDNKVSLSMKALEEEMIDTSEEAVDIDEFVSKEEVGTSLGSLFANLKL